MLDIVVAAQLLKSVHQRQAWHAARERCRWKFAGLACIFHAVGEELVELLLKLIKGPFDGAFISFLILALLQKLVLVLNQNLVKNSAALASFETSLLGQVCRALIAADSLLRFEQEHRLLSQASW